MELITTAGSGRQEANKAIKATMHTKNETIGA